MRVVTLRNKGGTARLVKEGPKGTTVEVDPAGSHGCKVGEGGVAVSGAGAVEIEAGGAPLIVQVLGEAGEVLSEQPIAAGATVTCTGSHELLVVVDPAWISEQEAIAAKEAADKAEADAAAKATK